MPRKIEKVIYSCHECRHMVVMQQKDGTDFYVAICNYSEDVPDSLSHAPLPAPFTIAASFNYNHLKHNDIYIPDNCPLEDYPLLPSNTTQQ